MLGESIVSAVVSRHSHNGSRSITSKDVLCDIDGTTVTSNGIDAVSSAEDACYGVVYHAFPLSSTLYIFNVFVYCGSLFRRSYLINQFAFRSQNEEGDTEHRVCSCGEDGERAFCLSIHGEGIGDFYLGTFASAYPVLLRFLDAFAPINRFESVEEALTVGADTQTPLPHLLLFNGIATSNTHAFDDFIVGEDCAKFGTPVHHRLAQESDSVVHQQVALSLFISWPSAFCLELLYELLDGLSLL